MLSLCLRIEFFDEVRVFFVEQSLRDVVSQVHAVPGIHPVSIAISSYEGSVHLGGVIRHELLDSCTPARTGIADLMEALKEWNPGEGVTARPASRCRGAIYEPLS